MLGLEPQGAAAETTILKKLEEKKSALAEIFAVYCDSDGKESTCSVGVPGSIPESGRSPGEGNGNPLQYSCLEDSMGRGAWQATVPGVAELDRAEQLTLSLTLGVEVLGRIISDFFWIPAHGGSPRNS